MAELPVEVRDLARRLGAGETAAPSVVRMRQHGRMRQDADAAWMPFRAKQTISIHSCAFNWRASTGPLGLVSVRDRYERGVGELNVAALGLFRIAHAGDAPEVSRGELMRYLAELPWAPDAIVANSELRWRVESPHRLVVAAGPSAAEVTIALDKTGLIAAASAPDRPRAIGNTFVPTPWIGRFADYRRQGGRLIPHGAQVGWETAGGFELCWEGRINAWAMTDQSMD